MAGGQGFVISKELWETNWKWDLILLMNTVDSVSRHYLVKEMF